MIRIFFLYFLLSLFCLPHAWSSGEFNMLFRGARAQAMGNAFVSLADDEEAIFINPAGMAGNKSYNLYLAIAELEISNDIVATAEQGLSAVTSTASSLSGSTLNTLMGKNIYGRSQFTPALTVPNFGVSILIDDQAALLVSNQIFPQINLGYQMTNGIQAAWGMSTAKRARSSDDFRFGVGAKLMWRRGGYHLLSLNQLLQLNISSPSMDTLVQLTGGYNVGYGADVGFQYLKYIGKRLILRWGLAMTDIGDTNFGSADAQKSDLTSGVSVTFKLPAMDITFAYDYKHILNSMDMRKKDHLGIEFALPMLRLYTGLNQVYPTYGATFDFWLVRITGLTYTEEQASNVYLEPEQRYMIQLSMKLQI